MVDQEFISLLEQLQTRQFFVANYQLTLPVKKLSREEMRERIGLPSAFNVDPLRMLYLLKASFTDVVACFYPVQFVVTRSRYIRLSQPIIRVLRIENRDSLHK